MKAESVSLIGIVFLGAMFMTLGSRSPRQSSETMYSTEWATLAGRAQIAKDQGKKRVVFPAPIAIPEHVESLSNALDRYRVLIVQPVAQESYPQGDMDIITWHKFRIIEDLTQDKARGIPRDHSEQIQVLSGGQDLYLQLREDEFLLPQAGGILNVDGITLAQETEKFPLLSIRQSYLLFVTSGAYEQTGRMTVGPWGVFAITQESSLEPIVQSQHPLVRDIRRDYGRSLSRFKAALGTRTAK